MGDLREGTVGAPGAGFSPWFPGFPPQPCSSSFTGPFTSGCVCGDHSPLTDTEDAEVPEDTQYLLPYACTTGRKLLNLVSSQGMIKPQIPV